MWKHSIEKKLKFINNPFHKVSSCTNVALCRLENEKTLETRFEVISLFDSAPVRNNMSFFLSVFILLDAVESADRKSKRIWYTYGGPQLSRQNQKPHGKNKIPHGKTKNLTAKPKTSRQNQILHSKNQIPHGKSKYPRQNQSYFAFAVKYLVLPWGFLFCREVFRFLLLLLTEVIC